MTQLRLLGAAEGGAAGGGWVGAASRSLPPLTPPRAPRRLFCTCHPNYLHLKWERWCLMFIFLQPYLTSDTPTVKVKVAQLCRTLFNPMNYTVHGILQARILEWVTFPSPGYLPNPGIKPMSSVL